MDPPADRCQVGLGPGRFPSTRPYCAIVNDYLTTGQARFVLAPPLSADYGRARQAKPPNFGEDLALETPMFKGSITALVTPMRNGRLDEDAFRAFVDWQIAEGTPRPRAGRHDRREPDAQP